MDLYEKTQNQKYIFNGRIINLRVDEAILPNGNECIREVVEHPGGVSVAALTDDNEVLFVKQYRYPMSEVVLELPAGKLEKGEDPFEAGKRELEEETGAVASKYYDLGKTYPTPAYCEEVIYLYAATGLSFTKQNLDDDEFLNVEKIPLDEAVEMVMDNRIYDLKTQTAILKLKILVDQGKIL